jgi:methionyl-tRNA formyltransferase
MNLNYEQVIIVGSGSLASKCIGHLLQIDLPIPMVIYETNTTTISTLESLATKYGILYINVPKEEIFQDLVSIRKRTIIFLLGCNYVIPKEVIRNENLSFINYHNSLLPKHPGRNAEAWAIYEQDSTTGITWHYVDKNIDTGDIIVQREIHMEDAFSSFSLLRLQNQLALVTFKLMINDLLDGTISSVKQNKELRGKLHLANQIPNDGYLDPLWDMDKIKAFLRAIDYGALRRMGRPKILINHVTYMWDRTLYMDVDSNINEFTVNEDGNCIFISKSGKAVKLMGLHREKEDY